IMKIYANYGFNDFILCLGYKGDVIKAYFYNYEMLNSDFTIDIGKKQIETYSKHSEESWKVTLVDTGDDSLKGSRLKQIEKYIDGQTFMVTYGDGVADLNISDLIAAHNKFGKIATVTGVKPPSRFGELQINQDSVCEFKEKPQASKGIINGGFFVFNRGIFDYLSLDKNCDLERGPLSKLANDSQLSLYNHSGQWACMDTYRDMVYLNRLWQDNQAFWKVWDK
ncbi:MAG: glucose-1-phosphate cytidylyltransferase, partial [Candidatus Omnitrophica bacterium]|nr:glucose-1-phosphate cytidylyltransferase [Candidatus Omnitrophota bacterium]